MSKIVWHNANYFKFNGLQKKWQHWLLDNTSLTQRLRIHCGMQFRVEVLKENWQRPLSTEAKILNIPLRQYVRIRQVYLHCHNQPWVFARTVIPQSSLSGVHRRLARLGTLPLGTILFAYHSLQRSDLQIAQLQSGDALYTLATSDLESAPPKLWGRRSIFYLAYKPLLVYEVFLSVPDPY